MSKSVKISLVFFLSGLFAILVLFDTPYRSRDISFQHHDYSLAGSLLLPENTAGPYPAVIFVHGDGPLGRSSAGYYQPYFDALTYAGFAVLSWDKAGVGESGGNWLKQSMSQRSTELQSAISWLRKQRDIQAENIGLIGFSQAGWVLPEVLAEDQTLAFAVFVSTAINWLQQGEYQTRKRLNSLALSQQQIQQALDYNRKGDERLLAGMNYPEYRQWRQLNEPDFYQGSEMSAARFHFVSRNVTADAREYLPRISQPVLALFGASDSVVDIRQSAEVYAHHLGGVFKHRVYPQADHGLFRDEVFAGQAKDTLWFALKMNWLGGEGLADGVITELVTWCQQHIKADATQAMVNP